MQTERLLFLNGLVTLGNGHAQLIADGLVVLLGHVGVLNGHGGDIGLTGQNLGSHLTGGVAQIIVADGQGRHAAARADALLTREDGLLGRAADAVHDAGVWKLCPRL